MTLRIDAHHHLWRYNAKEYDWIGQEMSLLRGDFLVAELESAIQSVPVNATVVVQARQQTEETRWLLDIANSSSHIGGVVGWLPIAEPELPRLLEEFCSEPLFKGLRHVVQNEPESFLERSGFNQGIECLTARSLVYDLLILEHQLASAILFVDRHPNQSFVLDHLGKPSVWGGDLKPWAKLIRELAQRPNVTAKISGLVTEADPSNWTTDQLLPYFETALEAFSPQRLMIGTDWPVLTLGCSYDQWWGVVEAWSSGWSDSEKAELLGGTAQRVYQITRAIAEKPIQEDQDGEVPS